MTIFAEVIATVFGLLGAWYVAEEGRRGGWGFVAFLIADAAGIVFALSNSHWIYVIQQLGFAVFAARGLQMRWGRV